MKIIINVSSIFKGGAEQVANSFINECRKFPEHEYHVFLRSNIKDQLNLEIFPDNFRFYELEKRPGSSIINLLKALRYYDQLEKKIQPDVVISTGGHGYWKPQVPLLSGFNIPHYIYPESPYFQKLSLKKKLIWRCKKFIHMWFHSRSDAIVVQTDDVKHRLRKLLPDMDVYTVSNTVNGCFKEPEVFPDKLPEREKGEIRLLTVSSYYSHKNLDVIPRVLDHLKSRGYNNIKFVLTLPPENFVSFNEKRHESGIYNVGPISINECPSLYKECDMMFLPTLLECFSASYVEAMAMEKPVLTSDLGFAHTICKDAALYFDPVNEKDIADKIIHLAENLELQEKLIQNGKKIFQSIITPAERAEKYLKLCEELVAKQ